MSLIQPGMVKTALGKTAAERRADDQDGPYSDYMSGVGRVGDDLPGAARWRGWRASPEDVAETILKAIEDDRPRARYRVAALRSDSC